MQTYYNQINSRHPKEGLRNCAKKHMWNKEVLHEEIPQTNEAANGSNVTLKYNLYLPSLGTQSLTWILFK